MKLELEQGPHKSSGWWKNLYAISVHPPSHTHTSTLKNNPRVGSPGCGGDEISVCCLLCEEHVVSVFTVSSLKTVLILLLQWFGLSLFLFGLGLNLIHLTILSPPLMNSSVAVWTHWTAGTHINTLWVCLLKAGCQIVLWTKGTEFRGMRLGSEILILSLPLFIGSWHWDRAQYCVR